LEGEYSLELPGETRLPGWHIEAVILDKEQALKEKDGFSACFDLDMVGNKTVVRCRRRGDKFRPLGMSQIKKLGEFMIDSKIPRAWRSRIPLVCSPEQINWVVGWHINDRVKVTDATRQILRLEFKRR
jgi:tRNA(Ile)-lysidine synthase